MRNLFFIGLMGMLFGLGIAPGHGAKGVVLSAGIWDLQEKPTHTVKSGETLFQISRMYNVAVNDLRKWNQLQSDQLSVGQILRVVAPEQVDEAGLRGGRTTHLVAPGETLFSISKMYGVTVAELRAWNELQGSDLAGGQELLIEQADGSA
ncbi:MAG: LysM peptidoglycan-binding domain-containing protein, partial [Balneolaceae bacterium]